MARLHRRLSDRINALRSSLKRGWQRLVAVVVLLAWAWWPRKRPAGMAPISEPRPLRQALAADAAQPCSTSCSSGGSGNYRGLRLPWGRSGCWLRSLFVESQVSLWLERSILLLEKVLRYNERGQHKKQRPSARPRLTICEERIAPSVISAFTPAMIEAAYDFPTDFPNTSIPADGRGQTIAIVDAGYEPNIVYNLQQYSMHFGLPQMDGLKQPDGETDPTFTVMSQGSTTQLPAPLPAGNAWILETDADVELAHSIAPEANILLVEANETTVFTPTGQPVITSNGDDLYAAANEAAGQEIDGDPVSVVSMSFVLPTDQGSLSHNGVTFVSTSPDSPPFQYPGGGSSALIVGGTVLPNAYLATLAGAGVTDDSSTSIVVNSLNSQALEGNGINPNGTNIYGTTLPILTSGSYFDIQVDAEQMAVLGLTINNDGTSTLDVIREVNGTVPSTHAGGAVVSLANTSEVTWAGTGGGLFPDGTTEPTWQQQVVSSLIDPGEVRQPPMSPSMQWIIQYSAVGLLGSPLATATAHRSGQLLSRSSTKVGSLMVCLCSTRKTRTTRRCKCFIACQLQILTTSRRDQMASMLQDRGTIS